MSCHGRKGGEIHSDDAAARRCPRRPRRALVKHLRHPVLGRVAFEYSVFAVDGATNSSLVIYNPATPADAERIRSLLTEKRPDAALFDGRKSDQPRQVEEPCKSMIAFLSSRAPHRASGCLRRPRCPSAGPKLPCWLAALMLYKGWRSSFRAVCP